MIPAAPSEDSILPIPTDEAASSAGEAAIASSIPAASLSEHPRLANDAAVGQSESQQEAPSSQGWWSVFASTYVTIFLAEIGDKTQVTTLLMSAESHKPWLVFAGAGTALVCTSLLGVLLGRWLATRLQPRTLEVGAGATLLIIATGLIWDILQSL